MSSSFAHGWFGLGKQQTGYLAILVMATAPICAGLLSEPFATQYGPVITGRITLIEKSGYERRSIYSFYGINLVIVELGRGLCVWQRDVFSLDSVCSTSHRQAQMEGPATTTEVPILQVYSLTLGSYTICLSGGWGWGLSLIHI